MLRKNKLFLLIPALALITLLLGIAPIKLVNKVAHATPFAQSHSKQGCGFKNCFSQSLISQNHFEAAAVGAASSDIGTSYLLNAFDPALETLHFIVNVSSIPLRC